MTHRRARILGSIALASSIAILLLVATARGHVPQEESIEPAVGPILFYSDRTGDWELFAVHPDGSGTVRLTDSPGFDAMPKWSPSGDRIAFQSKRDGNWEIYVMSADGSGVRRLTRNESADEFPSWSPDGRRIAFCSDRTGNYEIHTVAVDDEENVQRLTATECGNFQPAWSPDGTRIAFASECDGNSEIYVMNADGSGAERLTVHDRYDLYPAWSPDGEQIAFQSYRRGNWDIFVLTLADVLATQPREAYEPTQLTDYRGPDEFPAYSPDGTRIVYEVDRGNEEIYIMNADGSDPRPLFSHRSDDYGPDWRWISP